MSLHCRLCKASYPVNEKGKKLPSFATFNVYNKKANEESILEKLSALNIVLNPNDSSSSICRPCERGIRLLSQAEEFKVKWKDSVNRKRPNSLDANYQYQSQNDAVPCKKQKTRTPLAESVRLLFFLCKHNCYQL